MASDIATARKGDNWIVTVTRHLDGKEAKGKVALQAEGCDDPSGSPHVALAGSRAWLALGRKLLAADAVERAIECAKHGLEELNDSYRDYTVIDDTSLKLGAARQLLRTGQAENGAKMMLGALETRIGLYERKHSASLAGPSENGELTHSRKA